jgi:hypothetical protein
MWEHKNYHDSFQTHSNDYDNIPKTYHVDNEKKIDSIWIYQSKKIKVYSSNIYKNLLNKYKLVICILCLFSKIYIIIIWVFRLQLSFS